jgi:predicted  nucleic acid-binding Zn-ribbon protein
MHSDLAHLVRLQAVDLAIEEARRLIATVPERSAALDARIEAARTAVQVAKDRKAANDAVRRDVERDRAAVRARRSKYQDQTMAVKTNKEFHALQHEMQAADAEIAKFDDRDLELMMEADVTADRKALETEAKDAVTRIETLGKERVAIVALISRPSLALFEQVAKPRRGVAMSPLDGDLCSVCHVHVRPHIMQQVKRGNDVMQCENCYRILYFPPIVAPRVPEDAAS